MHYVLLFSEMSAFFKKSESLFRDVLSWEGEITTSHVPFNQKCAPLASAVNSQNHFASESKTWRMCFYTLKLLAFVHTLLATTSIILSS